MSLNYRANSSVDDFECNSAGCDLLGSLHGACGAEMEGPRVSPRGRVFDDRWTAPRAPYRASADQAREMATALRSAGAEIWKSVLNGPWGDCWDGTAEEWVGHVQDWIDFLESCDGYTAE